jgi:hypothetical protein
MLTENSIQLLKNSAKNFENDLNEFRKFEKENTIVDICTTVYKHGYDFIVKIKDIFLFNGMINFTLTDSVGVDTLNVYVKNIDEKNSKGESIGYSPNIRDIGKIIRINFYTHARIKDNRNILTYCPVILEFIVVTENFLKREKRLRDEEFLKEENSKKKTKLFHQNQKVTIDDVLMITENEIKNNKKIFRSVEGTVEWIYSLKEVTTKKKHITTVIDFLLADNLNPPHQIKCTIWGTLAAFFEQSTEKGDKLKLDNWQVCSYNRKIFLTYHPYKSLV